MSNAETAPSADFSPRKDLYQIFGTTTLLKRQKIRVIGNLDEVYGFDLVFIIYLILETGLSGYLNIVNQKNEISGVVFSNGKIVKIDLPDRDTLFGQLLIQEGYVTVEALNKLIQSGSSSLGEQLISNKIITKEQFIELLLKQMRLRLSKYINNVMYRINFVENDEGNTLFSIDQNQYLSLAHDWIAGRFDIKWLTMHYMEFSSAQVVIKEAELEASGIKDLPLAKIIHEKKMVIVESKTLETILSSLKASNEADLFLKSIHFLIIAGYVQFIENQAQAEEKNKSFIQKIYSNMIKKSEVEMLESVASILKIKPTDIDGIYNEINRAIERSSEHADEEVKIELSRLSLDILSRKKHYIDEYNKVHSKNIVNQEVDKQLIDQIKLDLLQKNFYAAMNKLNKLKKLENQTPKIRLYLIWARVASAVYNKVYIDQKSVDRELIQILPEDKNSPDFYYVMSLIAKLKNDKLDVIKFFNMAVKLDSKFGEYVLTEETFGDKFKKMFTRKNAIIPIAILLIGGFARAQDMNRDPNAEPPDLDSTSGETPNQTEAKPIVEDKKIKTPVVTPAVATPPVVKLEAPVEGAPESEQPIVATKVDVNDSAEAQAELFSEDQLPFRYLNQYFTYEVTDNGKVIMNEKELDFAAVKVSKENGRLTVALDEGVAAFYKTGTVIFMEAGDELDRKEFELKENKFTIPVLESAKAICIETKSTYSALRLCKGLEASEAPGVRSVMANDSSLSNTGQIVVQDSDARSNFKVDFVNGNSFYFETQRRKVYPAVINKWKDSAEIKVRFVDLDVQSVAWEEILLIDQRYFEIKMDPLVMLRQDILFSDPDLKSKAISKTLIQKKLLTVITKNKFTVNPISGYSQLIGDNPNLSVKLRTGMGLGVNGQYSRNFKPKWDWYLQGHFISTKILFEDTTKLLEGKAQNLAQISGGTLYHWKRNWDFILGLGLKTDMFMEPISVNQGIKVYSAMNKYVVTGVEWDVYQANGLEFTLPITFKFNLPGTVGSFTSQLGVQYDAGVMGSYRMAWGRVFASAIYGSRQQNYSDFNFKEDYYYMSGGVVYLF